MAAKSAQTKIHTRRQTCPNIASSLNLFDSHPDQVTKHSDQTNPSFMDNTEKGHSKRVQLLLVWTDIVLGEREGLKYLFHNVPIVECRHGESQADSATETLTDNADDSYFSKSYRSSALNEPYNPLNLESLKDDINDSDNDSEDDLDLADTEKDSDDDKSKSQSTNMSSDKEQSYSQKLDVPNNSESKTSQSSNVNDTKTISESQNATIVLPVNKYENCAKPSSLTKKNGLNFNKNFSDSESDGQEIVLVQTIQIEADVHEPSFNACTVIKMDENKYSETASEVNEAKIDNSVNDTGNIAGAENINEIKSDNQKSIKEESNNGNRHETDEQGKEHNDSGAEIERKVNKTDFDSEISTVDLNAELEEDQFSDKVLNKDQQIINSKSKTEPNKQQLNDEGRNVNIDFDHVENEKENINPENPSSNKESNFKTKDTLDLNDLDEPCISCLELRTENPEAESSKQKCAQCLSKKKSQIINHFADRKEVIDFSVRGEHQDASANQVIDASDTEQFNQSVMSTDTFSSSTLTFSSSVSTDSTMSRFWTHEMEGLNDVTLYIQCHSDISLLLLMENPEQYQENLLHSIVRIFVSHL